MFKVKHRFFESEIHFLSDLTDDREFTFTLYKVMLQFTFDSRVAARFEARQRAPFEAELQELAHRRFPKAFRRITGNRRLKQTNRCRFKFCLEFGYRCRGVRLRGMGTDRMLRYAFESQIATSAEYACFKREAEALLRRCGARCYTLQDLLLDRLSEPLYTAVAFCGAQDVTIAKHALLLLQAAHREWKAFEIPHQRGYPDFHVGVRAADLPALKLDLGPTS